MLKLIESGSASFLNWPELQYPLLRQNSNLNSKTNIDKFLKTLDTKTIIESVRNETVERISQLIAKTNQFKLNQNLFSVSELKKLKKNTLAVRLKDRMQDFGIVSAVVFNIDKRTWQSLKQFV